MAHMPSRLLAFSGAIAILISWGCGRGKQASDPATVKSDGLWYAVRPEGEKVSDEDTNPTKANMLGLMFLGELHILPGDHYVLTGMGSEGSVLRGKNTISLIPDKKLSSEMSDRDEPIETLNFKVLPDGTLESQGDLPMPLTLVPEPVPNESLARSTVSVEDSPFVGRWIGEIANAKSLHYHGLAIEKFNAENEEMILLPDNKFYLHVGFEISGDWRRDKDKLSLFPRGYLGQDLRRPVLGTLDFDVGGEGQTLDPKSNLIAQPRLQFRKVP